MARKLRVQYPGAIYHVMSRGDHLEAIYRDRNRRWRAIAGAATRFICARRGGVRPGCESIACWASGAFRLIALPGGNGLLVKWRRGGRRSKGETQRACREAGAAGARSFGRSCCSK